MLIINADDLGRDRSATDTALDCYQQARITSTSAMVFMEDSERAAGLANSAGINVGLHVNFTEKFNTIGCPERVSRLQDSLRRFLKSSKYALLLYNPFLRRHFQHVFDAQLHEFKRIYGRDPCHFDGHQHMHLSTNMLVQRVIPGSQRIRRSFSFLPNEKSLLNRLYRRAVDSRLRSHYYLADSFYALSANLERAKLESIFELARKTNVELMTHTWKQTEYDYLMSDYHIKELEQLPKGGYSELPPLGTLKA